VAGLPGAADVTDRSCSLDVKLAVVCREHILRYWDGVSSVGVVIRNLKTLCMKGEARQSSEVLLRRLENGKREILGARVPDAQELGVRDKNDMVRAVTRIREIASAAGVLCDPYALVLKDSNGIKVSV
jgi:hypothetical protein